MNGYVFFFIGIVCFLFIMGFFEAILMMDYTIYAKIPITLGACWVLLLSFKGSFLQCIPESKPR